MNDSTLFRRITVVSAIIAAPLSLGALYVALLAVDFKTDRVANPSDILTLGERSANLFRFAWLVNDAFGFYLLVVPVALYLWYWFSPKFPKLTTLLTFFGLTSLVIGVIHVVINAAVLAPMIAAYPQTSGAEREMMTLVFETVVNITLIGMGAISFALSGLWWIGIGIMMQSERRGLGIFTIVLGVTALVITPGGILDIDILAMLEFIYYVFAPLWALWIGIAILRGAGQADQQNTLQNSFNG